MTDKLNWLELSLVSLGVAGLGTIVAATLDSSGFLPVKIPHWLVILSFVLFFLSGRLWFLRSEGSVLGRRIYNLILFVAAVLAVSAIPLLCWGVIKRLIGTAAKGGKVF